MPHITRRNVTAACVGLCLAVTVVVVGSFVLARLNYPPEQLARVSAGQPVPGDEDLVSRIEKTSSLMDYVVFPLAAATAGIAVGLIASSAFLGAVVVSVLPVAGVQLSAASAWRAVALTVGYTAIAYLACLGTKAWRARRSASAV